MDRLNDVTQPMVHIGGGIMRCLGGTSSLWSGVEYRVTICKLIRMIGKFSGYSCAIDGVVLRSSPVIPICYLQWRRVALRGP